MQMVLIIFSLCVTVLLFVNISNALLLQISKELLNRYFTEVLEKVITNNNIFRRQHSILYNIENITYYINIKH